MPPGRQFPLAGSFHQSFLRLLQIVALFLMSDTRTQNGPFCDTYCSFAWTRDTVLLVWRCLRPQYLHVGSEELSEFLFSFFFSFFEDLDPSLFFQRFVSPVFLSRSVLTSSVCLSPLVAVVPYFFDITRHYHFSCVGKKMSWSLLSGKYLNFLAPLARLNNGLPRVKSKSLITCVICSRVVSSLELFGVHLLRTWNKSERWCHSFNIRQGPSRLSFAVNQ